MVTSRPCWPSTGSKVELQLPGRSGFSEGLASSAVTLPKWSSRASRLGGKPNNSVSQGLLLSVGSISTIPQPFS